jgi:hypothetical protein
VKKTLSKKEKSICVFDFYGYAQPGHFLTSMWAFWHPSRGIVRFGGDWSHIPDMIAKTEPSESDIIKYAEKFEKSIVKKGGQMDDKIKKLVEQFGKLHPRRWTNEEYGWAYAFALAVWNEALEEAAKIAEARYRNYLPPYQEAGSTLAKELRALKEDQKTKQEDDLFEK